MGEQEPMGDAGFVANAVSETEPDVEESEQEAVSTPPADGESESTSEVEETQGAVSGLEGEDDEVQAYLNEKYGKKGFNDNDKEQVLRWRKDAQEAKALKARLDELDERAKAADLYGNTLRGVASTLGPESVKIFEEKGAEEWYKWATGNPQEEPAPQESAQLDANDPRDRMILEMRKELEAIKQEKEAQTFESKQRELAEFMTAEIDGLKLPDDDTGTARGVLIRLADFELAAGGAKDPSMPTKEEAASAIAEAKKKYDALASLVSGQAAKKIEEGTPKTPKVVADKETEPERTTSDDWLEAEKNGFIGNALKDSGV